jgi:protoporphyrinogen oxidase
MTATPIVVLGAGPAGLAAAHRLARQGRFAVTVVERSQAVGGNAGSFSLDGVNVDYGSHRLHAACSEAVLHDIRVMLGDDLLVRPRHGRMCIRGRWVHFPLQPVDLLTHAPTGFLFSALRDAIVKNGNGVHAAAPTFASVLEKGLGRAICNDFYFPYARKIWGMDPSDLDAEQARRRVSASSPGKLVRKVLRALPLGGRNGGSGTRFFYPRNGFGAISEAYRCAAVSKGAALKLGTDVAGVEVSQGRAVAVWTKGEKEERLPAKHILSTIPITALVRALRPAAPASVLAAAGALRYRAMILIYLVLETDRFTEYDAHYFPSADMPITRLSEPKNYSLSKAPGVTVLCAELPCSTTESVWSASDESLGKLVVQAIGQANLPLAAKVRRVVTRRLSHAYPIYTRDYEANFRTLDSHVAGISGLVTLGRQGLFAHDNTHHTLAMAYGVTESLDSEGELNRERWNAYREEFTHHVVED